MSIERIEELKEYAASMRDRDPFCNDVAELCCFALMMIDRVEKLHGKVTDS